MNAPKCEPGYRLVRDDEVIPSEYMFSAGASWSANLGAVVEGDTPASYRAAVDSENRFFAVPIDNPIGDTSKVHDIDELACHRLAADLRAKGMKAEVKQVNGFWTVESDGTV